MEHGTLAVLGAGPKALAIAAKAAALRAEGWQVPDVVVVDRRAVAANWTGAAGYTDGRQLLGTPPEKDVGYPYLPAWGPSSAAVCDRLRHLSWHAFLIDRGGYAEWVDRGRPRPTHRRWGEYLGWVAERVPVDPLIAEVRGLDVVDGRWCLALDGDRSLAAAALVVTGPAGAPSGPGSGGPTGPSTSR